MVRAIDDGIACGQFSSAIEQELAAFWMARRAEIHHVLARADELGRRLQNRLSTFTLCHADIHTANLLIDSQGRLFVVDWDETLLAPKERDLMFIVGGAVGGELINARQEALFFADVGYGATEIDPFALAYYRYEWVVQEMGDYGERVFLANDVGDETKCDAVLGFQQLFQPGDVVEVAYASEKNLLDGAI